jgi:hypothetical protein
MILLIQLLMQTTIDLAFDALGINIRCCYRWSIL